MTEALRASWASTSASKQLVRMRQNSLTTSSSRGWRATPNGGHGTGSWKTLRSTASTELARQCSANTLPAPDGAGTGGVGGAGARSAQRESNLDGHISKYSVYYENWQDMHTRSGAAVGE
eukprot:5387862-Pleurochrysis_carterae.AAC.3